MRLFIGFVLCAVNAPVSCLALEADEWKYINSLTSLIEIQDFIHASHIRVYGRLSVNADSAETFIRFERCRENLYENRFGINEKYFYLDYRGRDLTHVDILFGKTYIDDKGSESKLKLGKKYRVESIVRFLKKNELENKCLEVAGLYSKHTTRHLSGSLGGYGTIYIENINGMKLQNKN